VAIKLMDCTLRDGANVLGKGFPAELTNLILDGLTSCHVPIIEFGNAGGIGAYEISGFTEAETDAKYFEIAKKYLQRGSQLGMFLNSKRYRVEYVEMAKANGLSFLRVGADAGDADISLQIVKNIVKNNLQAYYSLMKAYLLKPEQLAEEGKKLEAAGLNQITIMDSAGTMLPDEVAIYTEKLAKTVNIPIAFHGHNNLGLSAANALAAYKNGATILDCGLMGMARSAGNLATELCVAMMQRCGEMQEINLYGLLKFIDMCLMPAMEKKNYHNPIKPLDIILGISGCHSSNVKKFRTVAEKEKVSLYHLIVETSTKNRKNPSEELMEKMAVALRRQ